MPWDVRFPVALGLIAIAVLVLGFGIWGTTTKIAGAVISPGIVEMRSKTRVVQHPDGGVLGEVLVRDGDQVEAGQVLMRLDDTFLRAEASVVEGQLSEMLARKARLEAERDGRAEISGAAALAGRGFVGEQFKTMLVAQSELFKMRRATVAKQEAQMRTQIRQIETEILGTDAQISAAQTQLAIVRKELAGVVSLSEKGLSQASRVNALRRLEAELNGRVGQLSSAGARLRGQVDVIELEILRMKAKRSEDATAELRDIQVTVIELTARAMALRERLARLDIRAPVAGAIYDSRVFGPQAIVQAAQPILYIVPNDAPMIVAARVAAADVDQVFAGQKGTLRFVSFNHNVTPELGGRVMSVSADAFKEPTTGALYYQADVALDEFDDNRFGGLKLIPGMPAEVYLRTDIRTPLSFLVKPLSDYFSRALRG